MTLLATSTENQLPKVKASAYRRAPGAHSLFRLHVGLLLEAHLAAAAAPKGPQRSYRCNLKPLTRR